MKKSIKHTTNYNCVEGDLEELFNSRSRKEILCVYRILQKENCISSKKIIEIAFSQDYEKECQGCASADNLYRAMRILQEKGYIVGVLKKGGYEWSLITN